MTVLRPFRAVGELGSPLCVEGYDGTYESDTVETEIAGLEGEAADVQTAVNVLEGGSHDDDAQSLGSALLLTADLEDGGILTLLPGDPWVNAPHAFFECDGERAAYYAAVGAFVVEAGTTVWWAAVRKNPIQAWNHLRATAVALAAINVAYQFYADCMNGPDQ